MRQFLARHAEFVGNVAIIMSGRTLAAMIALFTMPIVARLFLPADFGVAAVFVSITSILSTIASLRYESALVLPKKDTEARALMSVALQIAVGFCLLLLLLVLLVEISDLALPTIDILGYWMWLVPLGVLLMAILHIQESWLTRKGRFKLASASLVAGNAITSGSRIAVGAIFGSSIPGLIGGYLLGLISRIAIQYRKSTLGLRSSVKQAGGNQFRELALRYSDFPRLNAPAGLAFSTGQNLPVLLFGAMFSPGIAGLYAMANRLTQVPVSIVSNSMRRVFLQKAAQITHQGRNLRRAYILSVTGLAVLAALPCAILWMFGQEICGFVLGDRWTDAGRYLEIMAPWLFALWVESPSNPVFVVLRKQKFWLSLQITLTVLRLAAFGVAYLLTFGPEQTLQAFVVASVLGNSATILTSIILTGASPPLDADIRT